jgi:predicted phosphohydrolase
MKIRYFSDIHLEFIRPEKIGEFLKMIPPGMDEVAVLAGDVGNPWHASYDKFMQYMSANFQKTFVIAGNHEYYSKTRTMESTDAHLAEYFRQFNNVSYLHNQCERYGGACFVGTTLWTNITNPLYHINDVYEIQGFNYIECNRLNRTSVAFLSEALKSNNDCVVLTHHMPSSQLIDKKYLSPQMANYNQWFSCDLDDLIVANQSRIRCWIYGHTHTPSQRSLHNIPFLCNPIGYPGENSAASFERTHEI